MRRWWWMWAVIACSVTAVGAEDGDGSWRDHVTLSASLRVRGEFVDLFEPPREPGR